MDWPKFFLENVPLIIAVALCLLAIAFMAWAQIYSHGYNRGHRRGWRGGYRRGWRNGRQYEWEMIRRDEAVTFPEVVETLQSGQKVRHRL